jgi:hypothetical protein
MKATYEGNEYRKNPKTNSMLSAKMTKIIQWRDGRKYEIITGHLAKYLTGGEGDEEEDEDDLLC